MGFGEFAAFRDIRGVKGTFRVARYWTASAGEAWLCPRADLGIGILKRRIEQASRQQPLFAEAASETMTVEQIGMLE